MNFKTRLIWLILYLVYYVSQTEKAESRYIDYETDKLGWVFDGILSLREAFRFTFGDPVRQTWQGPGWYGDIGDYIGFISTDVACCTRGAKWCDRLSEYRQYLASI